MNARTTILSISMVLLLRPPANAGEPGPALPARFGGEITVTDRVHLFVKVDLVVSGYFGVFFPRLTGPFNLLEAGVVYIL